MTKQLTLSLVLFLQSNGLFAMDSTSPRLCRNTNHAISPSSSLGVAAVPGERWRMELVQEAMQPDEERLSIAIWEDKDDEVGALLEKGVRVDKKFQHDVRYKIERCGGNATISRRDGVPLKGIPVEARLAGKTPLEIAVICRKYDLAKKLVEKGALVDVRVEANEVFECLCFLQANRDIPKAGDTLLHMVVRSMLLEQDSQLSKRRAFNAAPFTDFVTFILARGVQPNAINDDGETIFHALWKKYFNYYYFGSTIQIHEDLVRTLLLSQQDDQKKWEEQRTLYMAMVQKIKEILEKKNKWGTTVSDILCPEYELLNLDKSGWADRCKHADCSARKMLGLCGDRLEKIANTLPLPAWKEEKD